MKGLDWGAKHAILLVSTRMHEMHQVCKIWWCHMTSWPWEGANLAILCHDRMLKPCPAFFFQVMILGKLGGMGNCETILCVWLTCTEGTHGSSVTCKKWHDRAHNVWNTTVVKVCATNKMWNTMKLFVCDHIAVWVPHAHFLVFSAILDGCAIIFIRKGQNTLTTQIP